MSLKAQLDDLVAEKSELKAKADGFVDEVAQLKSESTKAQSLLRRVVWKLSRGRRTYISVCRPPSISCVVSLRYPLVERFVPIKFTIDWGPCFFLKPLPNWTPGR
jgi:hypothetical protein